MKNSQQSQISVNKIAIVKPSVRDKTVKPKINSESAETSRTNFVNIVSIPQDCDSDSDTKLINLGDISDNDERDMVIQKMLYSAGITKGTQILNNLLGKCLQLKYIIIPDIEIHEIGKLVTPKQERQISSRESSIKTSNKSIVIT